MLAARLLVNHTLKTLHLSTQPIYSITFLRIRHSLVPPEHLVPRIRHTSTCVHPGPSIALYTTSSRTGQNMSPQKDPKTTPPPVKQTLKEEQDDDGPDEWDKRIIDTGCAVENQRLTDCHYETKDWRKCLKEMQAFRECWKKHGNDERTETKAAK